ncbi:MAG: exopolysaccharide Pel transporter PelG [Campylobacteraceae bacterium]|jgi:uncharacterized membrane protein|nr:exopolysaccharide Pel transporter PelG [Campylobacteraceae bacterium]
MAGIGFELRKILKKDSYSSLFRAYIYAGIISSGPWILSILGVLIIGMLSFGVVIPGLLITQFQVSITYLYVFSLILTGTLQLSFTRYIADTLFAKGNTLVLPTFHGAIFLTVLSGALFALPILIFLFPNESILYRVLMFSAFITLSCIWIASILLSGMKHYKAIVVNFAIGYSVSVLFALLFRDYGLVGLLGGFWIGQVVLLLGMMGLAIRTYPSNKFISFDFLQKGKMFKVLIWVGVLYNTAVWIDKIMFWFYLPTSEAVIGPLRASPIYDTPIFLAYLSVIPGMAVFLVRIETDFVEYYDKFYTAVREGATLSYIHIMRNEMVYAIKQGIFEIIKIQAMAILIIYIMAPKILELVGISNLFLSLLYIDVIAAYMQIVLIGLLNIFFYLDKRDIVLELTVIFLILNTLFTALTLWLGALFYGYGYALSLLITILIGFYKLDKSLEHLEYETFMLR